MPKPQTNPLPGLVQNFFLDHLISQRCLSPCTVASYRDTFRLLFEYQQTRTGRIPAHQTLEDWDAPPILGFLDHLEKERDCCPRTRNARLAAIHCFMRYVSHQKPEFLALANRVLAIPSKRYSRTLVSYLTAEQIQAILEAPDSNTQSGRRDRILLQVLYNTGARVSEIVSLNRESVFPETCKTITLHGKGRKERTLPLWPKTASQLRQWLKEIPAEANTPLFTNRFGARLSRFGIEKRLDEAVAQAVHVCPSLRKRRVSPHVFRHTTAMHLLQSGLDLAAIALWLGHESPVTTHQYLEADLEMKKKILSHLPSPKIKPVLFRPKDELLAFLEAL
jgi:integrase/recombinase XerD